MTSRKGKLQHLSSPAIQLESYCFVLKLVDPAQHVWQSSYSASCNLPKISSSSSSLLVPPLLCRPGGVCCMSEMASLEWGKMAQRMKEAVCIHTTTKSETEHQRSQQNWRILELWFQHLRDGTPILEQEEIYDKLHKVALGSSPWDWTGSPPTHVPFLFPFLLTENRSPGLWRWEMKLAGNPNHHYCSTSPTWICCPLVTWQIGKQLLQTSPIIGMKIFLLLRLKS